VISTGHVISRLKSSAHSAIGNHCNVKYDLAQRVSGSSDVRHKSNYLISNNFIKIKVDFRVHIFSKSILGEFTFLHDLIYS
jgi:hypothetical protein